MRLRRVEPAKCATPASATATSSTTTAPARTTTTWSAKSTTTHHPTQHPDHCIRHIACSSTLPLCLCDCILHSLPDVILAITGQPIRRSHCAIHRHRVRPGRVPAQISQRGQLCSCGGATRTHIRCILSVSRHTQRLNSARNSRACRCRLPCLFFLCPRSKLQPELRHLRGLPAILSCGVDQNLLRLSSKRRQLRLHHIAPVARNRHGKRSIHVGRRRIFLPCEGIGRSYGDSWQRYSSGLYCPGNRPAARITRRRHRNLRGSRCCGNLRRRRRYRLSRWCSLAPDSPGHHQ